MKMKTYTECSYSNTFITYKNRKPTINHMATQRLKGQLLKLFITVVLMLNQGTHPKTGGNSFRAAFWLLFPQKSDKQKISSTKNKIS